jgi:lipopolysaccharide export system permease protein
MFYDVLYRAPLGAIIRKGGLGLPIIFAVLIFISFHFINTFGKKIAQENGMSPFMGRGCRHLSCHH